MSEVIVVKSKERHESSTIRKNTLWKKIGDWVVGLTAFVTSLAFFIPEAKEPILNITPDVLQPHMDVVFGIAAVISLYSRFSIRQREKTGLPIRNTVGEARAMMSITPNE